MKTPGEILIQRHRTVDGKLDSVRENALAATFPHTTTKPSLLMRGLLTVWRELIWPSRRIWAGLAAAWVVIVAVNLRNTRGTELAQSDFTPPSPAVLMALREPDRWFDDFAGPPKAPDADRTKKAPLPPRSEGRNEFFLT